MTLPPNGKATGETPTRWSVLLPATWPSSCNATIVIVGNAFLKILDGTLAVPSTRSGCSVNGPSAGLNGLPVGQRRGCGDRLVSAGRIHCHLRGSAQTDPAQGDLSERSSLGQSR